MPTPATRPREGASDSSPAVPAWRPLIDAKAGEWVEYETLEGRTMRYDVVKVAPSGIETRIIIREAGRAWGEPATCEDDAQEDFLARQAQRGSGSRSVRADRITAAGRDWQATLYEDRWTDEEVQYVRRTWVSGEVPYLGMVRMELYGDGQLEAGLRLTAWGSP